MKIDISPPKNISPAQAGDLAMLTLLRGPDVGGNNGKTVSGAGPSTPGPKLTPRVATGDAHAPKG